ncbi:MAG: DUF6382 domain-containing protein [Anaerovoracaceae bacterium]
MAKINSNLEIKYHGNVMEQYVRDILTLGFCRCFFPVCFVRSGEELMGNYKISGYRNVACIKEIAIGDILHLLTSLIYDIEDCEKHLLFCDEYEITKDTIFVDKGFNDVKMIYIPSEKEMTGPEKILELVDYLKEKASKDGQKYMDGVIKMIGEEDCNYGTLVHNMETMGQEVYLCGIE